MQLLNTIANNNDGIRQGLELSLKNYKHKKDTYLI
jgi:hypothetical protein